ncbi:Nuclear hormone receptor family member nhr-35 [Toxocara canis]|uniref:Nuclear hormone receptor family member nhr-35 n=1 Tax=Toxocara canis TaxID=6265 RepID=A0A0B2V8E6_TOXCA|nr:Nuclear hormone receptor family member nhr-35 [Toxocara canis]
MLKTEESSPQDGFELDRNGGELLCVVCGDQATGKHYGTIACNGCKGFFRRTIRRSYKYTCRFNGNCTIDKHNRAVCRACRYMRCINAGMKVDAVQNERDIIGKRHRASSASGIVGAGGGSMGVAVSAAKIGSASRPSLTRRLSGHYSPPSTSSSPVFGWETPKSLLESLLISEDTIQGLRDTVIKQTGGVEYSAKREAPAMEQREERKEGSIGGEKQTSDGERKATVNDIFLSIHSQLLLAIEWAKTLPPFAALTTDDQKQTSDGERKATVNDIFLSIHSQLLLAIEWAKTLPPFAALTTDDQTALLKSFACQHVVLCVSYRSKNSSDSLKLINDSCIPRFRESENNHFPENFYLRDCERVMDQLAAPMRFLRMDDVEFVAMKACILFNPVAKGLTNGSVMHVLSTRRQIFAALEHYVNTKIPSDANRLGDLTFFILSPLQTLANMISEDILVSKLSGVAHLDQLMEELILSDTDEQKMFSNRFQNDASGQLFKESIELASNREISHSLPAAFYMQSSQPSSPGLHLLNGVLEASPVYQNNWCASTPPSAFATTSDPVFVSSALNF